MKEIIIATAILIGLSGCDDTEAKNPQEKAEAATQPQAVLVNDSKDLQENLEFVEVPKPLIKQHKPEVADLKVVPKVVEKVEESKVIEPKVVAKVEEPKVIVPKVVEKVEEPKVVEKVEEPKVIVPKVVEKVEEPKVIVPKVVEKVEEPKVVAKVEQPKVTEPKTSLKVVEPKVVAKVEELKIVKPKVENLQTKLFGAITQPVETRTKISTTTTRGAKIGTAEINTLMAEAQERLKIAESLLNIEGAEYLVAYDYYTKQIEAYKKVKGELLDIQGFVLKAKALLTKTDDVKAKEEAEKSYQAYLDRFFSLNEKVTDLAWKVVESTEKYVEVFMLRQFALEKGNYAYNVPKKEEGK